MIRRSRTVLFIPDPFEVRRVPIAVLAEVGAVVLVEPVPLPDMDPSLAWIARSALDDIREAPTFDVLPDGCGPHIVLGLVHEPLRTLPVEVFEALLRISEQTEAQAELQAALDKGTEDYRAMMGGLRR